MIETSGDRSSTALVLSGGGVKGAYQAGALQVLHEAGFTFNAVSGVSAGSLNGVMLATGQFDTMLEIWRNLTRGQVLRRNSLLILAQQYLLYKIGLVDPPVSRYRNKPLQRLMERHLLGKSVTLPFHFGFVKLESGVYVKATVSRTDGHTIDRDDVVRILASTAIPVFFNPSEIGDSLCVDGGLRNISPIAEVLPFRPERVVIIPTEPIGEGPAEAEVRDILEIAERSIEIMLNEIFNEDIDRFLTINRLVRQAEAEGLTLTKTDGTPYTFFEPVVIDPAMPLGNPLDFGRERIRDLMEHGRERALQVLNGA